MPSTAIERAATLFRDPVCVGRMRSEPLPPDVTVLLRILAGDAESEAQAARFIGRSAGTVREAAEFYVTQVLFNSAADPYRILGVAPDATRVELRTNLALLLRWLHPDVAGPAHRGMAERAIKAWNDLKVPESRSTIDRELAENRDAGRRRRVALSRKLGEQPRGRRAPTAASASQGARGRRRRRVVVVALLLTAAVFGGVTYMPDEISGLVASFYLSMPSISMPGARPDPRQQTTVDSRTGDTVPPSKAGSDFDRRAGDRR